METFEGHYSCVDHHRPFCCPDKVGLPEKRLLYAIAYEYRVKRGVWKPDIDYLHAVDDKDAHFAFFQSESPQVMRQVKVVGVAPVIGYFVDDKHGEQLSA